MPQKTKTVYLAIEVPCYGIKSGLDCANHLVTYIESLDPVKKLTARTPAYIVKSVRVA